MGDSVMWKVLRWNIRHRACWRRNKSYVRYNIWLDLNCANFVRWESCIRFVCIISLIVMSWIRFLSTFVNIVFMRIDTSKATSNIHFLHDNDSFIRLFAVRVHNWSVAVVYLFCFIFANIFLRGTSFSIFAEISLFQEDTMQTSLTVTSVAADFERIIHIRRVRVT